MCIEHGVQEEGVMNAVVAQTAAGALDSINTRVGLGIRFGDADFW